MEDIKFKIFESPWTIKFQDYVSTETDDGREIWAFGIAKPAERKIFISTKTEEGIPIPSSEIKLTVLHEVIHAFLVTGQYLSAYQDEPLVEWLARCIFSMINSKTVNKIDNIKVK